MNFDSIGGQAARVQSAECTKSLEPTDLRNLFLAASQPYPGL